MNIKFCADIDNLTKNRDYVITDTAELVKENNDCYYS